MIVTIPQTGSTSADLSARLRSGELVREGEWLVADRQTAGRGRQGRDWLDGLGNFMGSTVFHPGPGDPPAHSLALMAGLAVQSCVAECLPGETVPLLKWPNDLMIGSAKLAGILLEREGEAVVVGIGVNLASAPKLPDRETAALADFAPPPARDAFATRLAEVFALELQRWRANGLDPLIRRWLAVAHPVGTPLAVSGEARLSGRFAGLDATGALQLRLADGTTQTINAGEVTFA
ncbi:MAG TPA: biotin--[acetyl-CoA-carboxylase] ligase [Novosphingobium sp.]|nr:biotin--[acetyl-CoA-carboxylase] ligase [Novosphingobium sp.]